MKAFNANIVKKDLIMWIKGFFSNFAGNTNAVIAVSGGKDSSIVAALCVEALGKERVKAILLPQHNQHDIAHSIELVEFLDIEYKIVNIGPTVDSIVEEMNKSGIYPTEQALMNVAARVRMTETYFYAQCVNGIPSCNCNLSENWIGWSTYGGDGLGSFAPLSNLTVNEVKLIGKELRLPEHLINKTPLDGLCGKTDEESFGFTYDVLDKYIRTGEIDDLVIKEKIDTMHQKNLFKTQPIAQFEYAP